MQYQEQLNSEEWKDKRKCVLQRDGHRCLACHNRSLINKYRVSLHGAGTTANRLVYGVFDEDSGQTYRCYTEYDSAFLTELLRLAQDKSIVALTSGDGDFCRLIATIVLPEKLDYTVDEDDEKVAKQRIQEAHLRSLSPEELIELRWLDTKTLHIHHKYYQVGRLAWEYPDTALMTLCWGCHEQLHRDTEVDVLDEQGQVVGRRRVCGRCHGAGWFPQCDHVEGGVCFECGGAKYVG